MSADHNTTTDNIIMPPQETGTKSPTIHLNSTGDEQNKNNEDDSEYYDKGSVELAVETPVMMQRLEKRRAMTKTSERLLIVLVGLPARGKSFISRKLYNYLTWRGNACKVFNVGQYRRQATTEISNEQQQQGGGGGGGMTGVGVCNANFFDDSNQFAAEIRERAAQVALKDTLEWLEDNDKIASNSGTADDSSSATRSESPTNSSHDYNNNSEDNNGFFYGHTSHSSRRQTQRIAIFDATNSTKARRAWILQQCDEACEISGKQTGVVFVESICDDKELLQENFESKISTCPDFAGMSHEEALKDLQERVNKYEARYETIDVNTQASYIKIYNLSSRLVVNHVYGRLAKVVIPALMSFNTGSQPIFLCRAGETKAMRKYIQEKQESLTNSPTGPGRTISNLSLLVENGQLATFQKRLRGDRLGEAGLRFRDKLCDFIEAECVEYMNNKPNMPYHNHHPSKNDTGTSISGLRHQSEWPCLVMSSTMPRALETASWERMPFHVKDVSNLNPLDMGDFAGMDLETIKMKHPEWYKHLEREPFHTRFPGGESYSDLINRLESVVIDMEQQLGPTVVVSHVSVLQVLLSYFRSTPVSECTSVEIPMHTVLKFVPLRGGGWLESHHKLVPETAEPPPLPLSPEQKPTIWGDSSSCLPTRLSSINLLDTEEANASTVSNNSGVFVDE